MDREKVIKGLQNLRDAIATDFIHEADQAVGTIDDALALLKEQDTVEHALEVLRQAGWKETQDVPFPAELLKEQEEAKTVESIQINRNFYAELTGYCPSCNRPLKDRFNNRFCGNCGQAVKWE